MKDTKSVLLLVVSFLLVVVSGVLLWTWGYRIYRSENDKKEPVAELKTIPLIIPAATVTAQPDKHIDSIWNNADSLNAQLNVKLNEFNRLRNEINTLLQNPTSSADLGTARQKIIALQRIVDDLRNHNQDIENENKRLQSVLQQLSAYIKNPSATIKRVGFDEKTPGSATAVSVTTNGPDLSASDLRLSAIMLNNEKEEETAQAGQAEKLVGSFMLKNNTGKPFNSEMQVVVIQPDGQVLKGSSWESGVFTTSEGKKIYSYKLKVDLSSGETRKLLFSLSSERYQPGNYTMQLYHNGMLIGKYLRVFS